MREGVDGRARARARHRRRGRGRTRSTKVFDWPRRSTRTSSSWISSCPTPTASTASTSFAAREPQHRGVHGLRCGRRCVPRDSGRRARLPAEGIAGGRDRPGDPAGSCRRVVPQPADRREARQGRDAAARPHGPAERARARRAAPGRRRSVQPPDCARRCRSRNGPSSSTSPPSSTSSAPTTARRRWRSPPSAASCRQLCT